ncbi:hypothetical protein RhiirA4_467284 [Rhizophagus irregularis]|uniref:Uncharacterized protein n=1 Tax=Rhizophagus irregularis TaxID=588596 RepID=A0A2I1GVM9_9GLOM|nr:hypothetical protein RhiirA4_467284 [Rhizophagus irregularis]
MSASSESSVSYKRRLQRERAERHRQRRFEGGCLDLGNMDQMCYTVKICLYEKDRNSILKALSFRKNIRAYNGILACSSFGTKVDESFKTQFILFFDMTLSEEQFVYREYWEKPYGDMKTIKILIENLKPKTREIDKARAIQLWGRRASIHVRHDMHIFLYKNCATPCSASVREKSVWTTSMRRAHDSLTRSADSGGGIGYVPSYSLQLRILLTSFMLYTLF